MLRLMYFAIAGLSWISLASAQAVESTSSIGLIIENAEGIYKQQGNNQVRETWHDENAKSTAKMVDFERRLAGQAQRAMGSVCDRCFIIRNLIKTSLLQRIVNPASNEMKIADPAQAPLD